MTFPEYGDYDGLGLAGLVRRGEVSPGEVLEAAIERIERLNPRLNALVYEDFEGARSSLAELPDGPFRGVPFPIKDLGCPVAGMPMTDGSRFLQQRVSMEDGALTRAFRAAGLVLLGKTNTPEFGISGTAESALFGPCRNPWDLTRTAGGSSGGAAAAVAAGMVPLAHGSDGAGSLRIPAACCGLVGLKPSRGRHVPAQPLDDVAHAFVSHHVLSRSVRDSAAMLDVTANTVHPQAPPRPRAGFLAALERPPGRLRIAFSEQRPSGGPPAPFIREALREVAAHFEELGHRVEEAPLPLPYEPFYDAFATVSEAHFAAAIDDASRAVGRPPAEDELEPVSRARLQRGRRRSGAKVIAALQTLAGQGRAVHAFFRRFDVFLDPVLADAPPAIGYLDPVAVAPDEHRQRSGDIFFMTLPFNATGQPAIALPLVRDGAGLPIGFQLAAGYGEEVTLLRLARQLEESRPWCAHRPPVYG